MNCNLCKKSVRTFLCDYCTAQFPFHSLDNDLFQIALYEFKYGTISYNLDQLESLFFNPILYHNTSLSDHMADLDRDTNNQNFIGNSTYETVDNVNEQISAELDSFSIFHLNARSLVKNHKNLSHLLANIHNKFSVLAITETWIKENDANELNFDGYNFINNPRTSKAGGGVALYVDQRFTYKILTEFNVSDVNVLESLFVEITIPRMKNIIIGVIYRPPSEYTLEFLEKLNELVSGITKGNKYCYITGDFNLDLLKHESHSITAQFLEALFSYGCLPMITKPTRITAHSATLIDNIFTNNTKVSSKNGLIVSDISDHLPIFSIVTAGRSSGLKNKNYMTVRDMSEKRTEEFKTKLENTDWEFDKESGDPNASYDVFIEKFTGLFDSCFPFKIVRGKALNSFKKPWLTKALLKSINKKNKLYKQYLRNRRSDAQFLKYKKYKNKLTYLLRIAKKRYYEAQIDKNKDNIKLTWKILNSLINRTEKKSLSYPQLHDNGQDITNPEEIANKFCQYFTSIDPNLASKIPPASKSFREFINRVPSNRCQILPL